MSVSQNTPTNKTSTTTQASEQNLSNTSGVTVAGNTGATNLQSTSNTTTNTTNISTDDGAVQAGTTLGQMAIGANTGLASQALTEASDFGSQVLDELSASQTASATLVSNFLSQGAAQENQNAAAFTSIENSTAQQYGNITSTLANIAAANNGTQSGSQAAAGTSMSQTTLYVIAGVALIAIYLVIKK